MCSLISQETKRPHTDDLGRRASLFCVDVKRRETKAAKFCVLFAGRYVQDSCVYGPGDLPWIIQSPSLFASQFDSAEPLVVTCLERWHRLRVLGQAEVPEEPHWHFQRESHLNRRLNPWAGGHRACLRSYWCHCFLSWRLENMRTKEEWQNNPWTRVSPQMNLETRYWQDSAIDHRLPSQLWEKKITKEKNNSKSCQCLDKPPGAQQPH